MSGYGQYCPVAKAAEVLGEKWSILILRELSVANQTFNSLRRGMPLVSPALLSKRLKTLAFHRVIKRVESDEGVYYCLDDAGEELKELIMQLGVWGQRWVRSDLSRDDLDPSLLMWDMHRTINLDSFPEDRRVVQFEFLGSPSKQRFFWLVIDHKEVEICMKNPGYDVDFSIRTALKEFTAFWMGELSLAELNRTGKFAAEGKAEIKRHMSKWLCGSAFAGVEPGR